MSKAQCLSLDMLTALPETIIETILCLLPIEEAARTSILSRDWRYKWTKIPKLVFRESSVPERTIEKKQTDDIASARKNMDRRCKLFYVIHQVLLLRQAPIHEFKHSMNADFYCFEIDQILLHLSRNHTIKKLKLKLHNNFGYKLPSSFFSLHHLTELYLHDCEVDCQLVLTAFGSLISLYLRRVEISTKDLLRLLSHCPSLKSLSLFLVEDDLDDDSCTIIELFECLPVVEHLAIWADIFEWLVVDPVPRDHPASLIHLKYFCFEEIYFADNGLAFLAVLIKCSPNLEKIRLEIDSDECDETPSDILEEYSNVRLEHLNEMEIKRFGNLKPEMEFVKFILARSPKLKKVSISSVVETDREKLEMLEILLRAPHASPVEIIFSVAG